MNKVLFITVLSLFSFIALQGSEVDILLSKEKTNKEIEDRQRVIVLREAKKALKQGFYDKALGKFLEATKYTNRVYDFIGELYLIHRNDKIQAVEWFEKSGSGLSLFYLYLIQKDSFWMRRISERQDPFCQVLDDELPFFMDLYNNPNWHGTFLQRRLLAQKYFNRAQIQLNEELPRAIVYLLLGEHIYLPILPEKYHLESQKVFFDDLTNAYDHDAFLCILTCVKKRASAVRLPFIAYIEMHARARVKEFLEAKIRSHLLLCELDSRSVIPKTAFILDKESLTYCLSYTRFIFPLTIIAEANYRHVEFLTDCSHLVTLYEALASQIHYPELRLYVLIRTGQLICRILSNDDKEIVRSRIDFVLQCFTSALREARQSKLKYFESWASQNLYWLAEKFDGIILERSINFETQRPNNIEGLRRIIALQITDYHKIKSSDQSMSFYRASKLILNNRYESCAALVQILGAKRYKNKKVEQLRLEFLLDNQSQKNFLYK